MNRLLIVAALVAAVFVGCRYVPDTDSPEYDVDDVYACRCVPGADSSDHAVGDVYATAFGAKAPRAPWPITTNRMDGLRVMWQPKGKIFNTNKIVVANNDIGGIKVTEVDGKYVDFRDSGLETNLWNTTTVSNNGHYVEFVGSFEDLEAYQSNDGNGRLVVFTGTSSDFDDPSKYVALTNNPNAVHCYKQETFNSLLGGKYDRTQVSAVDVSDLNGAITAFNELLRALKAQQAGQ